VSAEGDYRIPDVSPGTWTVLAQLPSQVSVQGQVQIGDGDQEVVLDLQLPTGATLSGRITRDGKPLPGVMVFVQPAADENRMQAQARTAWDGTFRLERLPPATYKLLVLVSPEAPYTRLVEVDGDREVMIEIPTPER
ncbi:MAG: carboxypeptidase regulatory-like domain-containing protein, partial [Thermoanaerobaculia bacterium]